MDSVSWSDLPEDIFLTIAGRLHTVIDYLNVSQVCKPWRSTALSPLNRSIPSQPPFLMLAVESKNGSGEEDEKNSPPTLRGFVEFNNQGNPHKVCSLSLPEIHDDVRVMGSTGNWLILIDLKLDIFMFNPFTKTKLQFPSQYTLPNQLKLVDYGSDGCDSDCDCNGKGHGYPPQHACNVFIQKAVLSSSSLSDVVMMIAFGSSRKLAIARPGGLSWTPVEKEIDTCSSLVSAVNDVIVFKDQFYSVNSWGIVAGCDVYSTTPPKAVQIAGNFKIKNSDYKIRCYEDDKYYLVEWLGKLLMVARHLTRYDEEPFYKTDGIRVYMFDFNDKEWEEVTSLGEYSLFVGFNTSVSLLVSEHSSFKRNCFSFTDDNCIAYLATKSEGGHDMGVFDLNDKTFKPHYNEVSTSFHYPPLWIIPQSIC